MYLYYPVYGYNNTTFLILHDVISNMTTPSATDVSYIERLNDMLRHPDSMSWDTLKEYADSVKVIPNVPQMHPTFILSR